MAGAAYTSSEFPAVSQKSKKRRAVSLNFHTEIVESLPRPYDTKCDPFLTDRECKDNCFAVGLRKFGFVPFQNTVLQGSDLQLLSHPLYSVYLRNATIYKHWMKLERKCHERCLSNLCSINFTMTYAKEFHGRTEFPIELVVNGEAGPRTKSMSKPRFPLYDFFYQIFCLLSFWLGFSFVGLDFIRNGREDRVRQMVQLLYAKSSKLLLIVGSLKRELMSRSPSRVSLLRTSIHNVVCTIGMCLHLVIPLIEYFSYPTILLTTVSYEQPIDYKLTICSEAQELYEKGIVFEDERADKSHRDLFDKDIQEILNETQRSAKLDFSCGYWGLKKDRDELNQMNKIADRVFFESNNSSLCQEMYSTQRHLRFGDICFLFQLRRELDWTRTQMFHTFNEVKTMMTVSINSSLISSRFTALALQRQWPKPFHSSLWTPKVRKEKIDVHYSVSYVLYVVTPLPYPYSDKGFTPGHITYCFHKCTNEKMQKLNLARSHLMQLFGASKGPVNHKMLTNSLRSNRSINSLANWADQACNRKCSLNNFWSDMKGNLIPFTVTLISEPQPYTGPRKGFTRFDLRRTDDPVIEMKFFVAIFIYDLIIDVGSIISIWFGLSVIHILHLVSEKSTQKIHSETIHNLKSTKVLLKRMSN